MRLLARFRKSLFVWDCYMFVLGILTAETCGLIIVGWTSQSRGPDWGRSRSGVATPTVGFYLSFEAVWGPIDARLDFTERKMSSFDIRSTDVRLTWNLAGSLLESFWDDPLAPILMPWSRGASPPVGLILRQSAKTGPNVVGMTWNLRWSFMSIR